jgi:hypothetical protein
MRVYGPNTDRIFPPRFLNLGPESGLNNALSESLDSSLRKQLSVFSE